MAEPLHTSRHQWSQNWHRDGWKVVGDALFFFSSLFVVSLPRLFWPCHTCLCKSIFSNMYLCAGARCSHRFFMVQQCFRFESLAQYSRYLFGCLWTVKTAQGTDGREHREWRGFFLPSFGLLFFTMMVSLHWRPSIFISSMKLVATTDSWGNDATI